MVRVSPRIAEALQALAEMGTLGSRDVRLVTRLHWVKLLPAYAMLLGVPLIVIVLPVVEVLLLPGASTADLPLGLMLLVFVLGLAGAFVFFLAYRLIWLNTYWIVSAKELINTRLQPRGLPFFGSYMRRIPLRLIDGIDEESPFPQNKLGLTYVSVATRLQEGEDEAYRDMPLPIRANFMEVIQKARPVDPV
jgi:Zn-dependent protease with chaperone function